MRIFFSSIAFLIASVSFAQQTGAFSLNIDFDEPDYTMSNELAFYVPTDYDMAVSYPLIVGFRGGPHTGADHLRDQLQPLSDSLNCIIMCPESVALWQGSQEELVKPLFQYAVDTTAALYNIDMDMIYVTGLSFGGRHTVIAGMDIDAGPIYPGLRGIIPFAAGTNSENVADYGEDTSAPICTCIGSDDSNFYEVSTALHSNATAAGHSTFLNEIPGVGHTMAFPTFIDEMMECIDFIELQYAANLEEYHSFEFSAYPNPVADVLRLEIPVDGFPFVEIIDGSGKLVMTYSMMPSSSFGFVDMSNLRYGAYLVRVTLGDQAASSGQVISPIQMSTKWVVKE
jgi:hypothetical protein